MNFGTVFTTCHMALGTGQHTTVPLSCFLIPSCIPCVSPAQPSSIALLASLLSSLQLIWMRLWKLLSLEGTASGNCLALSLCICPQAMGVPYETVMVFLYDPWHGLGTSRVQESVTFEAQRTWPPLSSQPTFPAGSIAD